MKISKTIVSGAIVSILGFLEGFDVTDFSAFIPDQYEPLIVSGIGFLMIVLRLVTKTPVGK